MQNLLEDLYINMDKLNTTYRYLGSYEKLDLLTDSKPGDIVNCCGVTYCYTSGGWDPLCGDDSESQTRSEPKIISFECKHCGASQFTKIKSKTYKCDYCDCIIIYD